jgi:predicted DNA-binding protein
LTGWRVESKELEDWHFGYDPIAANNFSKEGAVSKSVKKIRGEHCINIFVSYQLKERIQKLAEKYDRTMADIVRTLIKVGIPVMEGITEAEERLLKDYVKVIRRSRRIKEMKKDDENEPALRNQVSIPAES